MRRHLIIFVLVSGCLTWPTPLDARQSNRALTAALSRIYALDRYTAFDWITGSYEKGTLTLDGFVARPDLKVRVERQRAWAHGARVSGATIHFVDTELDGGPIILQGAVPVLPTDTPDALATRILVEEHRLYPAAIRLVLAGGWRIAGRRFLCGDT